VSDQPPRCADCGKPLQIQQGPGRRKHYCSATCRSRARRKRDRAAVLAHVLPPFAKLLADGVRAAGGPLQRLAEQLRAAGFEITTATLSNWQTGRHLPRNTPRDRQLVLTMERVLELAPGELLMALAQTRELAWEADAARRYLAVPAGRHSHLMPARKTRLERRIFHRRGGATSRQGLLLVRNRERYVLGLDGRPAQSRISMQFRALESGVDSYWYVRSVARGSTVDIRGDAGCHPGATLDDRRQYPREREYLLATELLFDEPLQRGQVCRIAFTVQHQYRDPRRPGPETEFGWLVPSPATREVELLIEFHPDALPWRLNRCTWELTDDGYVAMPDGPMRPRRTDRVRLTDPAKDGYGWVWEWPEAGPGTPTGWLA
jgi:hypothetical protein